MHHIPTTNQLSIYCDGGARGNPGPAASAFVVLDENKQTIHKQGFYLGVATNNQAEYQAVIEAHKWLLNNYTSVQLINFYLDSLLVVNQLNGLYKIKDENLNRKFSEIKTLSQHLKESQVTYTYIPRAQNSSADLLVNQTLDLH